MKRPFKVWYPKHTGPLPDRWVMERGAARELLTTWELTQDKQLVDKHLARMDKLYGKGAEERIRAYMREIRRNERLA
jgi:hypothetical protein